MCDDGEVADLRNYMCMCPKEYYGEVRSAGYRKVKERMEGLSLMAKVLKDGLLLDGEVGGADGVMTALDATSGR